MTGKPAIDDTDAELIELLTADSRQSNRAIARDLGLSEVTLRKRLKRLEESGTITYGLIVDVRATGMDVSGYLDVQVSTRQVEAVATRISEMDLCAMCCITTGRANIRAFMYAASSAELAQVIESIAMTPGVMRVDFHEATGHALHRYELIMPDGHIHKRWGS
jgi:Lrp/AsnC family transcriptional regulator for asnA, asnC and gidA